MLTLHGDLYLAQNDRRVDFEAPCFFEECDWTRSTRAEERDKVKEVDAFDSKGELQLN